MRAALVGAPTLTKRSAREVMPGKFVSADNGRAVPQLSTERKRFYSGIHKSDKFTVDAAHKVFAAIQRKK
jgi:hypothetical protein